MIKLAFCILTACGAATAQSTTIILVRHAERVGDMSNDDPLTQAGRCRAEALSRMLAGAKIQRIYTSGLARVRQTAEPVAKAMNIQPEVVPDEPAVIVAKIRSGKPGETALIVGRTSTLPDVVRLLGGSIPPIGDNEYDRLILATIGSGPASVVTLRYPGCVK